MGESKQIVIDTCVLLDCLIKSRERHQLGLELVKHLQNLNYTVLIPAHSFFELTSAIIGTNYRTEKPLELGKLGKEFPVQIEVIDISLDFVYNYLIDPLNNGFLPNFESGDMIFAAIAKKHGLAIISEDKKLISNGKKLGIEVLSIKEFVRD